MSYIIPLPKTYGYVYIDLEKYKIPFPRSGIYVGFEYLGASEKGAFYLSANWPGGGVSFGNDKGWGYANGLWLLYTMLKPAISLELTE